MSRKCHFEKVEKQRLTAVQNGKIIKSGDKYILNVSIPFTSPCTVAMFVLGSSTNGWIVRKNAESKLRTNCFANKKIERAKVMKYKYTAVLELIEGSEEYSAKVPDLPGCISSGFGVQDTIDMIIDAASIWLVCAEDKEMAIPVATAMDQLTRTADTMLVEIQINTTAWRNEDF